MSLEEIGNSFANISTLKIRIQHLLQPNVPDPSMSSPPGLSRQRMNQKQEVGNQRQPNGGSVGLTNIAAPNSYMGGSSGAGYTQQEIAQYRSRKGTSSHSDDDLLNIDTYEKESQKQSDPLLQDGSFHPHS